MSIGREARRVVRPEGEHRKIIHTYFAENTAILLTKYRDSGIYPAILFQ